ncbi:MAG: hypothetical protein L6Q78_15740 [Bacteroidia bacterium]|nr:hypothetical protein [Bacteroidia bacterium]
MGKFNLIYLRSGKVILSLKSVESWTDLQDRFEDYLASLDFTTLQEVNEFLSLEYRLSKEVVKKLTEQIYALTEIELDWEKGKSD